MLKKLEETFFVDFSTSDDRYVLDENGNVTELYLDGCWKTGWMANHPKYFSDLSVLIPLGPHLKVLYVDNWKVKDMTPVQHFPHLKELSLLCNQINEIRGIENLIKLEHLQLAGNRIGEIKGLEKLIKLKILDLSSNGEFGRDGYIKKIEGLDSLVRLEALYLDGNMIQTMENLNHLTNLKRLTLHENEITTFENIDALSKLTRLTVGNKLNRFPDLSNHLLLEELGVQGNFDSICNLDFLESLEAINIEPELNASSIDSLLKHKKLKDIEVNFKDIKGSVSQTFWTIDN